MKRASTLAELTLLVSLLVAEATLPAHWTPGNRWQQQRRPWSDRRMCAAAVAQPPASLQQQQSGSSFGRTYESDLVPKRENQLVKGANWAADMVKDSFRRFKAGMTGQWDSFQRCKAIRERLRAPGAAPVTYEEFMALQRGKEDRNKLLQVGVVWVAVPEAIPFVLSFLPGVIPSTFENDADRAQRFRNFNAARVRAALALLDTVDKECLNKNEKKRVEFAQYREAAVRVMKAHTCEDAFGVFEAHTFALVPADTDAQQRRRARPRPPTTVEGMPGPLAKGLAKALGLCTPWMPAFLCRGPLREHLRKVAAGDAVLARTPLDALRGRELREAACARALDAAHPDERELRRRLAEWLRLTGAPLGVDDCDAGAERVFVPERAKAAMLAVNVVASARAARESELPKLLLGGPAL